MARVTYGVAVTEFEGSIGGVTFQRNASGAIAKLRSNPTVNPSALQATYQNNMAMLVSYWPTLSQASKNTWDAFAIAHLHTTPWGETKTLSGYQWFLSCNLNHFLVNTTIITTAPAWTAFSPPDPFTIIATSPAFSVEWDPPYSGYTNLYFYLSLPLRQSSAKLRRSLFFIYYKPSGAPLSVLNLTTYFQNLINVDWPSFFASANCSIIVRIKHGSFTRGLFSHFTSAIIKIN